MSVLVYVEQVSGKFKKSVFEAVSYAKAIADKQSTNLTAISIGNVADGELKELGKYGATKVLNVTNEQLNSFVNQAYAAVIAEAAKKEGADLIVLSNSFSGKGLAPRIAVKLKAGLIDGAVELPSFDGGFSVKKTAFSGKAFAITTLTSDNKIIALNPNAFGVKESAVDTVIENFTPEVKA
ncbi:MAG TPA: hypothetical protein VL088_13710, partial [Pedobacter sp.]|nr:hypothetical protein [Pedobacter sp.]